MSCRCLILPCIVVIHIVTQLSLLCDSQCGQLRRTRMPRRFQEAVGAVIRIVALTMLHLWTPNIVVHVNISRYSATGVFARGFTQDMMLMDKKWETGCCHGHPCRPDSVRGPFHNSFPGRCQDVVSCIFCFHTRIRRFCFSPRQFDVNVPHRVVAW